MDNLNAQQNENLEKVSGGYKLNANNRVELENWKDLDRIKDFMTSHEYAFATEAIANSETYALSDELTGIFLGDIDAKELERKSERKDPTYRP